MILDGNFKGYHLKINAKREGTIDYFYGKLISGRNKDNALVIELRESKEKKINGVGIIIQQENLSKVYEVLQREMLEIEGSSEEIKKKPEADKISEGAKA